MSIGRCSACAIPLLSITLAISQVARGVDKDWTNTSGGFFQTTTNWDPAGVPGSADRAIFDLNTNYNVTFFGGATNSRLLVSDDQVTFNLAGSQYNLTNTGSTSLIVGLAGIAVGAAGQLYLTNNGTLSCVSAEIGRSAQFGIGGTGTIGVTNNSTLRISQVFAIGSSRPGNLIVNSGGDVVGSINTIGQDAVGSASISGAGSTWTNTNWIDVGGGAAGSISITAAAQVSDDFATVGVGAAGTALVDGLNSRWTHASDFTVGGFANGVGLLNVTGGGAILQPNSGAIGIIGDQFNSQGTVNIDGAGSRWTNTSGEMRVGYIGQATLNISNGGLFSAFGNDVSVGHSGGGDGTVVIGGASATLNARSLYVGGNSTGVGGFGTVVINAGGQVQTSAGGVTKIWSNGRIDLAGGMLQTGSLQIAAGGAFNWTSGTLSITNATLPINAGAVLGNNLTVGAGKSLIVPEMHVGEPGAGSINVTGGGTVSAFITRIGLGSGSAGSVSISGPTSNWFSSDLTVGDAGDAFLSIAGGATLTNGVFIGQTCFVAAEPSSTARIVVDGAGSRWDCVSDNASPGELHIGQLGQATLQLSNGAMLTNDFGFVTLGDGAGPFSAGSLLMSGGAQWTVGRDVIVGRLGRGFLSITGGSDASDEHADAAINPGSFGTIEVSGAGSTWTHTGNLVIANGGNATITISAGAAVTAADSFIGAAIGSTGRATLQDPGSTWTSNGSMGQLIVGSAGTGSLGILNGGVATAKETFIGDGTGAVGNVIVSGPGAALNTPELAVGFSGHGTLAIQSGGAVHTDQTFVPVMAGATGWLQLDSGAFAATTQLAINSGGRVKYNGGAMSVGALQLAGTARLELATGRDKVVRATSLAMSPATGGTIDLADNFMIVDYAGASPLANVKSLIGSAYNGGSWNGSGITSFLAHANQTAVGYAEAAALFTMFPATFAGQQVDNTSILIAFTRDGDANLDGTVNLADFNRLASNFGQPGKVWSQGDFNYDGTVNLSDFNKLASNFGLSASSSDGPTPQDWANLAAAVPEPVAGGLSFAAIATILAVRKRSAAKS
jgi:T5SS/PEP-CTERM-associated repeat protein